MRTYHPKNIIWHVRITDREAIERKKLSVTLQETEADIDRRLWEQERRRVYGHGSFDSDNPGTDS